MHTKKWTLDNVPDLTSKVIIVTGGNSGLGYESSLAFAANGAQVIIAARSVAKADEARRSILKQHPNALVDIMQLDLMQLASVRSFAEAFKQKYNRLDVLLNNAGIMMVPYGVTVDGIERQQATNHFGHFALTGHLLDVIKATPKSRVVNVSSMANKQAKVNFDNLLFEGGKGYSSIGAYALSKIENLWFTYELQRYFERNNIDAIAAVAHPGVSNTNLFNKIGSKFLFKLIKPLFDKMTQPAEMGALPQIRASVDYFVKGADYYGPDGKREMRGYPQLVYPTADGANKEYAAKLWAISEKITGVKFN